MKQIIICALSLSVLLGLLVILFSSEKEERQIDLSTQNIHQVHCMDEYGNLEIYHINIPSEVQDLEAFSAGFCKSLRR